MKLADNIFPSRFAISLAAEVNLYLKERTIDRIFEWDDHNVRLIEFQQMSLVNNFDDCLFVYHEQDLTPEQVNNLKIIYKVTPTLMNGILFGSALKQMEKEKTSSNPI